MVLIDVVKQLYGFARRALVDPPPPPPPPPPSHPLFAMQRLGRSIINLRDSLFGQLYRLDNFYRQVVAGLQRFSFHTGDWYPLIAIFLLYHFTVVLFLMIGYRVWIALTAANEPVSRPALGPGGGSANGQLPTPPESPLLSSSSSSNDSDSEDDDSNHSLPPSWSPPQLSSISTSSSPSAGLQSSSSSNDGDDEESSEHDDNGGDGYGNNLTIHIYGSQRIHGWQTPLNYRSISPETPASSVASGSSTLSPSYSSWSGFSTSASASPSQQLVGSLFSGQSGSRSVSEVSSGSSGSNSSGRSIIQHTQSGRPVYAPRRYDEEFQ